MKVDKYTESGGDEAWKLWFKYCSVDGVLSQNPELAHKLDASITSIMYAQLSRFGFEKKMVEGESPVAFFDSYFLLDADKKEKKGKKPLKQYYLYRQEKENISLKELVCGVLFSDQRGCVCDVVRNWIAVQKGWKPRTLKRADGTRALVWETACFNEEDAEKYLGGIGYSVGLRLDMPVLREIVKEALVEISSEMKVEKQKVALLLYVTAQNIAMTNEVVLRVLGVGKSRAYEMSAKCMSIAGTVLQKKEFEMNDILSFRLLLSVCQYEIGDVLLKELEQVDNKGC